MGDFVLLQDNERIPADLLVIANSNHDGRCYMETSTLDGEKNLKPRESIKKESYCRATVTIEESNIEAEIDLHMRLNIKHPSYILYEFDGHLRYYDQKDQLQTNLIGLDSKNLLLKGAKVKNTKWVIGLVLYTGKETKIQLNATTAKSKMTVMEKKLHKIVITIFVCQLAISIFSAFGRPLLLAGSLASFKYDRFLSFIRGQSRDGFTAVDSVDEWMIDGFRYFLLLNTLIPISLVVSLEVVRLVQSTLTRFNYELHCQARGIPCKVNTSTVNEELGQIQYILSDKTGTLTQNKMVLQGVFVGDQVFGGEFSRKEGKVHYESFAEKQKRNKKRILTALDEQFDHSLHNLMKTAAKVRLRKPVVVSNQLTHDDVISVGNSSKSNISAKMLKIAVQPIESRGLKMISGMSGEMTPSDGIFPRSITPNPRFATFFKSPEGEGNRNIAHDADQQNQMKGMLSDDRPMLDQPIQNYPDKDLSEEKPEIKFRKDKITNSASKSRFDRLPSISITKTSSLVLDRGLNLPQNKMDSHELSLLSANDSIDYKEGMLEEPQLKSHHSSAGSHLSFTTYQELISEFFLCAAVCHQCVVETEFNGDRNYQGPSPDEIAICKGIRRAGCEFIGSNSQGEVEVTLFGHQRKFELLMVDSNNPGIPF
jgi:magnesium-transporting ATPase (P-type)